MAAGHHPQPHAHAQRLRRRADDPNATLLEALVEAGENVWRKLSLFAIGLLHLLFSSDKQWLRTLPASSISGGSRGSGSSKDDEALVQEEEDEDDEATPLMTGEQAHSAKRIIFVRHAESEWNVVFNRGVHWRALLQFVRACVREWLMLPTQHSIFIDSPLSRRGVRQAQALRDDAGDNQAMLRDLECGGADTATSVERATVLRYLSSALPDSIVVASNLRRAIDTARIGSAARLEHSGEKIHVLSSLQEIGRNIDTLTISDAYAIKPHVLSSALRIEKGREDLFNLTESHGNKAVLGCARTRLQAFAAWASRQEHDVLVVYGHSLWFKAFCHEFLPRDVDHEAKRTKLANCGIVSFTLEERRVAPTEPLSRRLPEYRIVPESFLYVR